MAYQKKYFFQFKDIRLVERLHLVELWQNTETILTAEEVNGHMNPFSVEMPEIDNKFQVVRGSGCQINLLSETDMKFFTGLYHINPTDFMVKHYINGSINWLGYLNSEMMTEPYDIDFNYQVSTSGNDGFSLMDRFSFIQSDETNYTGIKSKFELLQIVFAKIGLPFTEYRIALSTTFTGYSGAIGSTILHESFVDCANFYDEDDKPMSLREVVESIFAPYGAHIRAELGNVYITDVHSLASLSSVTYKRFSYSTDEYIGAIAISNVKAIADIGYMGTGHSIERSGGVNRQVVAYSPYPVKTILDESLIGIDEFETVPESFSAKDGYYYKTLGGNEFWNEYSPATFEISYWSNYLESNIYLRVPNNQSANQVVARTKINQYVVITGSGGYYDSKTVYLRINGNVLFKTKDNPYDTSEINDYWASQITLYFTIRIGDKYYDRVTRSWIDTPSYAEATIQNSSMLDNFIEIKNKFGKSPGWAIQPDTLTGDVVIEIWSDIVAYGNIGGINPIQVKEIWFNNLSITLSTIDDSEIPDTDVEYIGLLDKTFQNEGEKITLTCGTDVSLCDRGKIMKYTGTTYADITRWTRNGQSYKIEELLLGSVSSNYRAGFVTLMNMKLKNSFALQNILTDTFIGAAKMMVKSSTINYQDNVIECSLIEISPDELIIVK